MTAHHTSVFELLYQLGQLILLTLKPCEEEVEGEEGEEVGEAPSHMHTQSGSHPQLFLVHV